MATYSTSPAFLVYGGYGGKKHFLPVVLASTYGGLIDPVTDDDMSVIGWSVSEGQEAEVSTASMFLAYRDSRDEVLFQPWDEVEFRGTLCDPYTDDDLLVIGWTDTVPE